MTKIIYIPKADHTQIEKRKGNLVQIILRYMKANMGSADRVIRTLTAITIGILYFAGAISGTVAIALLGLAVIFIITSVIRFCPLYLPFGLSTWKGKSTSGK
jgi:hypothetical protein